MELINKSVYLKVPSIEELSLTEYLLNDPDTMKFNQKWGGTVSFPKEQWSAFFDQYIQNPDRHYFHIYNLDGIFVGEVSSRYDDTFQNHVLNIKVLHKFRGNHHGSDALELFLEYMFDTIGIEEIIDHVGYDSIGGIKLLESFGFREMTRTNEYILLGLKKSDFY